MHDVFCYFESILALHLLFTVMYFKRSTFPYIESTKHPVLPPFSFSESAKYSVFSSVFFHGINNITPFSPPFSSMESTHYSVFYSVFFHGINRLLCFLLLHQQNPSFSLLFPFIASITILCFLLIR